MSSDKEEWINAMVIFEIIGRPPEFLTETLNKIIEEVGKEPGIEIVEKSVKEPVLMKDQKDFYTSFAEIEIKAKEIFQLSLILFKYMPAHMEIISPENLRLTNNLLNDMFNEIVRKLHAYDEVARVLKFEKSALEKKLRELTGEKETEK